MQNETKKERNQRIARERDAAVVKQNEVVIEEDTNVEVVDFEKPKGKKSKYRKY